MPDQRLVLVTGATRGLGYALALGAAEKGAHVIALGRSQGALDDLADAVDATSGSVTMVPMDITDDAAIAYLTQSIFERWQKLDIWLHTAWFSAPMQPAPHLLPKDLDKAWNTNIRATARLIALLNPILLNTKDSRAVFFEDDANYGAHRANIGLSKAAQMQLVRDWQAESRTIGPRVEIFAPKPFVGQLRATLYPGEDRDKLSTPRVEANAVLEALL